MKNVNEAIIQFSDEVVKSAKRHLGGRKIGRNKNYGVASGNLKRSLSYRVRVRGNEIRQVTFGARGKANKYAAFVHWGVNGTQKNQGSPFFKFRKQPPSSVFIPWIKAKGIRLRDAKGRFKEKSERNVNSLAFLIARSVKRKGIVGLRFYEKAFVAVEKRFDKKFGEAIVKDIREQFKLQLGKIQIK
jgi:hypothetical protein